MSKEIYEKLIKYYPVEQLLVKGKYFILERNFLAVAKAMQSCYQEGISHELLLSHVRNKIGPVYQKALKYLEAKRDKDVITALLGKTTSIRFGSTLENKESRSRVQNTFHWLEKDLSKYEQIKKTSLTVRTDMTVQQQHEFHRRVSSKRKISAMRTIAEGRGAKLKIQHFPELPMILEGLIFQICYCY